MRTGMLEVTGGRLETAWWGPGPTEAPTLVLLHEGLGSVALWREVPGRLAEATGCGVFAYSRFGYGNSDTTFLPRPMTYLHDEALVVLPEVLRAAGVERAVLIGHSDGGSIAAIHAGTARPTDDPDGRGIPYDGSTPKASDVDPVLLGLVTIAAHFIVEALNIVSIRQIKDEYDNGALRQRLIRHHRDVDAAFRGWNDAWLDPRFLKFDITAFLPNIPVPILALQGADDPYGSDVQLRVLQANVNAPVTTHLIEGAEHSPHLEAGEETLALIASFIAALPRGAST